MLLKAKSPLMAIDPLMTRNSLLSKNPSDPGNNMKEQCAFLKCCNRNFAFMKCNNGNVPFMKWTMEILLLWNAMMEILLLWNVIIEILLTHKYILCVPLYIILFSIIMITLSFWASSAFHSVSTRSIFRRITYQVFLQEIL